MNQIAPMLDCISLVGIVTGTAKTFEWLDGMMNDTGRSAVARWLKNDSRHAQIESWAMAFPKLIDHIFGSTIVSARFFVRSCIASCIAMGIVTLIGWRFLRFLSDRYAYEVVIAFFVSTLLTDYVSLIVSRAIVIVITKTPEPLIVCTLLLIDLGATFAVAAAGMSFSYWSYILLVNPGLVHARHYAFVVAWLYEWTATTCDFMRSFALAYISHRTSAHGPPMLFPANICFFSAFFTSVWLWIYVVSGLIIKILQKVGSLWSKIVPYLALDDKPMVAVGRVAGILLGALYLIATGLAWISHYRTM